MSVTLSVVYACDSVCPVLDYFSVEGQGIICFMLPALWKWWWKMMDEFFVVNLLNSHNTTVKALLVYLIWCKVFCFSWIYYKNKDQNNGMWENFYIFHPSLYFGDTFHAYMKIQWYWGLISHETLKSEKCVKSYARFSYVHSLLICARPQHLT